jgi:hypothetical protein
MNTPTDWETLAGQPLDSADDRVMNAIATLYDRIDPVPGELVDRLKFAISLEALNAELAQLQQLPADTLAGARGAASASEVKTLTFTSDSLTTMVTISPSGPDRVRIDGWAAPGAGLVVELRQLETTLQTDADEDGRFVFDDVPHGLTRFTLRSAQPGDHPPVITPAVAI